MATAHLDGGEVLELPDDLSDEAIDYIAAQHTKAAKEAGALRAEIADLRKELREGLREVVAAVTAPRELVRDGDGRPQRSVSLYEGGARPHLDDDYGHLESRPT